MLNLTQEQAQARAVLLRDVSYQIDLDLTGGPAGFTSRTVIRFGADPGASTFVELKAAELLTATLNGCPLDPGWADGRLALPSLAADNELVVAARMAYSDSAEGLHRCVDPADGLTYLYGMSFLDNASRIFACFDQPDLKAPITLRVTAPEGWLVAANGELARQEGQVWEFAPTVPLATYLMTVIAGPYEVRRHRHDGVPLAIYARRSLAGPLDRDLAGLWEMTTRFLDRFHELFGVRYPFTQYDQAFVPDFNAGAMENPGLVTLRDEYLFRSAVTAQERQDRAETMAHEMAHMWFGDLVTMRWWDDLWLNESFAKYLGLRVVGEVTEHGDIWASFAVAGKRGGYVADQRPSTHPVAPAYVADTAEALTNFDGISYAKGAAALRQLVAFVGDDAFLAGLRQHIRQHAFGNATLADLLVALAAAAGRDLADWADVWLRQPQVNTLALEVSVDGNGRYSAATLEQTAPAAYPTLRPHRIRVAAYDLAAGELVARPEWELDVAGASTALPQLVGQPVADLLLPNAGDLTFAKIRLDPGSAAHLTRTLPCLADPLARALLWSSVVDQVRDAAVPLSTLTDLATAALPAETQPGVVASVLGQISRFADTYVHASARAAALAALERVGDTLLRHAEPGGSIQLAAARAVIDTMSAEQLTPWLVGGSPTGLAVDLDLRWRIGCRLAALGRLSDVEIEQWLAAERSDTAEQWAARARAARPDPAAKAAAWRIVVGAVVVGSHRLRIATAQGFWHPDQIALTAPFVQRFVDEMPVAAAAVSPWAAEGLVGDAFPWTMVQPHVRTAMTVLTSEDEPAYLRRPVRDRDDQLGLALAARGRW